MMPAILVGVPMLQLFGGWLAQTNHPYVEM
jgi:hypothetical protein